MFNKTILKNKLKIVSEEIPHVRSVSIGIWMKGGVIYEDNASSGITHFIEHMMFKGTKKRSARDIANEIEGVGGTLNAATSKEYICLFSRVMSDHVDKVIDIISDIILNSTYEETEIKKEKKVICEEIKMYEDNPQELIHDLFLQTVFGKYKIGKRIIGSKDSVMGTNREKITKYVEKFYKSSNMLVAVAGHIRHNDFVHKIEKYFSNLKNGSLEKVKQNINYTSKVNIHRKKLEQVHLCLGTKGIPQGDKREYALAILDTILGGGMSSRLFQKIREEMALCYSIYSFHMAYFDCGAFGVYAGCDRSQTEKVIKEIIKEFNKIKNKHISRLELKNAKEHLKGNLMLALENTSARMFKIGRNEFYLKKEVTLDDILDSIDRVQMDDIIELSQDLIKKEYFSLAILGNIEEEKKDKYKEMIMNLIN